MTSEPIGTFPPQRPVQPQHLEYLGKQAASLADSCGLDLTEAVIRTLASEKLGSEQVTRVVEFANIEAFQKKFSSMGADMRVVDIEGGPADPQRVLQALNDQARPAHIELQTLDYEMPPTKQASFDLDLGLGKTSSYNRTREGIMNDVLALQSKLAAAQEEAVQSAESARYQMTVALEQLQEAVKTAARHHGLMHEDIVAAWAETDPEVVGAALKYMPTLPSRGSTKVAHRVNPQHPVVRHYAEFAKHAHRYGAYSEARKSLERRIVEVEDFLKERMT